MATQTLSSMINDALAAIDEVDVNQAEALIAEGYRILDVREPGEFANGSIENAMNVPRGVLEPAADLAFPGANPALRDNRDAPWLVLCQTGGRSALATHTLQQMGFTSVKSIKGGFASWAETGKAIT